MPVADYHSSHIHNLFLRLQRKVSGLAPQLRHLQRQCCHHALDPPRALLSRLQEKAGRSHGDHL